MSSSNTSTAVLISLVEQLQVELSECKKEIRLLKARVCALEEDRDFEVISETVETSNPALPRSSTAGSDSGLPEFRVKAAEEIGQWIRRGLRGEHRGLSGREKIPQSNQYYLIVRDLSGKVHNPPLLLRAWSEAKPSLPSSRPVRRQHFCGITQSS